MNGSASAKIDGIATNTRVKANMWENFTVTKKTELNAAITASHVTIMETFSDKN